MNRTAQIVANLLLYGLLVGLAIESLFVNPDPWFAFVVLFVLFVAAVTSVWPGIRAARTAPGDYPFED
ncbi:MAG: hypothetical protein ACYC4L_11270 [Chloroflexota bacterium]